MSRVCFFSLLSITTVISVRLLKGEAAVAILIQKKPEAKRIYAEILSTRANADGFKKEGFTFPGWRTQKQLIMDTMKDAGITGEDFAFFEAHGTGTPAGDPTETKSIAQAVCSTRTTPLIIGSTKATIGHTEGASGLSSIAKIIIAYQKGVMAPSLNHNKPNPNIPELFDGSIIICNKPMPFVGGIVGINNFGIGGGNASIIINSFDDKTFDENSYKICEPIPRLVLICGRNNRLTQQMITKLENKSQNLTKDFLSLLNEISDQKPENGMKSRGYLVLDDKKNCVNSLVDNSLVENQHRRPVWFVFTGLGSQWPSMAQTLMKIEIFAKSFERSMNFLESIGADVRVLRKYLLETEVGENGRDIKPIITSLAVIQIGFVDLFNELGVKADGIIGHSVGEIVAAYADGCITAEDVLQISYSMHTCMCSKDSYASVNGVMAAVGLSWAEAQKRCFGTVSVACNNSPDLVTMTGNIEDMKILFTNLKKEGVFHLKVENHGLTAHSPLMKGVEQRLITGGKALNIKPNQRSNRWLSTTYREDEWNDSLCQWPSGEYFAKNLCKPVLFYDSLMRAPKNCLFIEIGPSGLLRHSIGKSFGREHNIQYREVLRRDNNTENLFVLLSALGQLYISGQTLDINKLYTRVEYPISRGTDFISPLLKWDHNKSFLVTKYPDYFSPKNSKSVQKYTISIAEDKFLADHKIDGRVLYPGVGYIYLVWKTMAASLGITDISSFAVDFKDLILMQATPLTNEETTFKVTYSKDNCKFFVEVNNTVVAKGSAKPLESLSEVSFDCEETDNKKGKLFLSANDFYKEVRVRGYDYGPHFQGLIRLSSDASEAQVKWTGHLVSFIDCIMHLVLLDDFKRFLRVPTRIERLKFDPKSLYAEEVLNGQNEFIRDVVFDKNTNEAKTKGLYMKNVCLASISRKSNQSGELVLEKYELIPYEERKGIDECLAQTIQNYSKQCNKTIEKFEEMIQKLRRIEDSVGKNGDGIDANNNYDSDVSEVEEELKDPNKELLKCIHTFYSRDNQKQKNERLNEINLDNDLIHSTLLSERFLRPSIDVFVENSDLTKKITVLEVNTSGQTFYSNIMKVIGRTAPGSVINNVEYTLCHSNQQLLAQNILDSKRVKIINFDSNKSVVPYNQLSPQNLIVFRDPNISLSKMKSDLDYLLLLRSMETALSNGGFLLAFIRDDILDSQKMFSTFQTSILKRNYEKFVRCAEEAGLQFVCRKSDSFTCSSVLFRKIEKLEKNEIEVQVNYEDLNWLESLKQSMKDESLHRIWLTSGQEFNGITGLVKGLQKEENGWKVRSVFFDSNQTNCETALKIAKQTDLVQNVFRDRVWGSYRHISLPEVPETRPTNSAQVRQLKFGDLSSFKWSQSPNTLWPLIKTSESQTIIDVYYSPMNFKDVMHATGRLPPYDLTTHMAWDDVVLGLEFVGRTRDTGSRVMGLNSSKALSTDIVVDKDFLWSVPDRWTMAEAATVPCVYATAYYALVIRGRLKCGETVLIHAGTGGVGQAAINICLSMSCKVLTTVGTQEKRQWIRKRFPQLSESCIASSRDVSFEERVMKETNGRGVDLILNSLTDQMFWASLRCLANNGRFCEIGKYQFVNNDELDSSLLLKNKTFHGIYLDALFGGLNNLVTKKVERERQWMWQLVKNGIDSGVVLPLPQTIFSVDETESAFRFMASGKHIGKVVVQIREEEPDLKTIARPMTISAIPLTFFNPKKSYIITGGLGGMGIELMYWMYERNARNFVLTSRSGVKTATQEYAISRLRDRECKIIVSTGDSSDIYGAKGVLLTAQELGPIGGVFLLTLVLEDDLIENQTIEKYERVLNAKSTQALVFDQLTREMTASVDHFVAFSSCSCGRGITGQTNYAFANSILERICDKRRADGLNGLAVQWGFVGDVGVAADN